VGKGSVAVVAIKPVLSNLALVVVAVPEAGEVDVNPAIVVVITGASAAVGVDRSNAPFSGAIRERAILIVDEEPVRAHAASRPEYVWVTIAVVVADRDSGDHVVLRPWNGQCVGYVREL